MTQIVDNAVQFSAFMYKDKATDPNTCANWIYFTENAVNLPIPNIEVYAISLVIANEDLLSAQVQSVQYDCSTFDVVNFILGKIASGAQFLVSCNGHNWRQFSCSGSNILCVDCKKDCSQCPGYNYIMQPCGNKQCYTDSASAALLSLAVRTKITYPQLASPIAVLSASQTSITISINVTRPGNVYCLAYDTRLVLPNVLFVKTSGARNVSVISSLHDLLKPFKQFFLY